MKACIRNDTALVVGVRLMLPGVHSLVLMGKQEVEVEVEGLLYDQRRYLGPHSHRGLVLLTLIYHGL